MTLLAIVLISAVILTVAYFTYGRLLSRLLQLDPDAETPAVKLRDDVDYVPIEPKFLLEPAFLGHRGGRADRRADPGRGGLRLGAGLALDPGRLDLYRRRARHDLARGLDPPQGSLDRRSRPRSHEPAVIYVVSGVRLDSPGLHHRGLHRRHGQLVLGDGRAGRGRKDRDPGGGIATSSLLYLVLADHHGPAAPLHAVVAQLGHADLRAAGGHGDLGRRSIPFDVAGLLHLRTAGPGRSGTWRC